LEESLVSLEVAAGDETVKKEFKTVFPLLDLTYSRIIDWELGLLTDAEAGKAGTDYINKIPMEEKYIPPRKRLELLFGDDLPSFGSIGEWSEGLVKWEEVKSVTGASTGKYRIKSYATLKLEAQRFADWKVKSANQ
jgi:hypothetical protein